jgi:hypothetical protein
MLLVGLLTDILQIMAMRKLLIAGLVVIVGLTASSCGGSSEGGPLVGPSPTTVGTVSENVGRSAVVRDANAIRKANESGRSTRAIQGVYSLLNRANAKKDANDGAAMLTAQLPALVERYGVSYPLYRAKLLRLKLRTQGGEALRQLTLQFYGRWSRELPRFRDDVASSSNPWGAVIRFGKRNNAANASLEHKLGRILAKLPPGQRKSLLLAVQQVFGTQ